MLFEFDKYDRALHQVPPAAPLHSYQLASDIEKSSLLYWAEHCVECAAPSCYETCDLYQPRLDTRCRRFTFGAFKNKNFPASRGFGVEISFKKWAKMQAYGNLRLTHFSRISYLETFIHLTSPVANAFGRVMARLTKKVRWKALSHEAIEMLVRRLDFGRVASEWPHAFLLEVYNPDPTEVRLQLNFACFPHSPKSLVQLNPQLTRTLVCPNAYSRHQIDFAQVRHIAEGDGSFLISISPEADNNARVVFLSADFVKFTAPPASTTEKKLKCLVFDLDNTLWRGVLLEDGDRVTLQPEIPSILRTLDDRGILLSIASKNDHDSAWRRLQQLGLANYFLYPQINWNPKSQSVRIIAERLNIGIDSLAFIDDNPFELDEVSRACPEAICINAAHLPSLASDPRFQGSSTPDARARRQMYQQSAARDSAQQQFASDYLGFLASCQIELEILDYSPDHYARIAELVQRTNQLNFSGHKHTQHDLDALLADPRVEKFVLRCSDRYGSYGTVGFSLVEFTSRAVCVRDFMLSCRVQGKLIESSFFQYLLEQRNSLAASSLWINFRPTPRNRPAQNVLQSLGFRHCTTSDPFVEGMLLPDAASLRSNIIRVRTSSLPTPTLASTDPR